MNGVIHMLKDPHGKAPPKWAWFRGFTFPFLYKCLSLGITIGLIERIGLILFILPGIYLMFVLMFTACILVEYPTMPIMSILRYVTQICRLLSISVQCDSALGIP